MNILITGTSKGIGKYLAEHYLAQGHQVCGISRTPSEISHAGYRHYTADLADEASLKKSLAEIHRTLGGLDALINNAGIASMNHFLLTPTETAKQIFDINFFGTMIMCRDAARLMRKSQSGRIINFTTVAVPLNLDGEAVYAASKAAVESLTRILAKELAQFKITVNAVGPTPIQTALIASVGEKKIAAILERQAVKRMGKFSDVSNVTDFFLKPESEFVTGQIIYLGGVSR